MHASIYRCLLLSLFLFTLPIFFSQEKIERESRVKVHQIPELALSFIDSLSIERKIKWYREEKINGVSFEAKFRMNQTKYSIEFDTLGNVEDIETERKKQSLPESLQATIMSTLKKECLSFKLEKIQLQFSGSRLILFSELTQTPAPGKPITRYEIVVRCKSVQKTVLYEYLLSETGDVISQFEIVFKPSSHLEY
jgi:hypothetical protein